MKIRNFVHKGLKRLYEEDNAKGLPPNSVDKLRKMFAFMDAMEDGDELRSLPDMEAARYDRRPKRHMEPTRHAELATDFPDRRR